MIVFGFRKTNASRHPSGKLINDKNRMTASVAHNSISGFEAYAIDRNQFFSQGYGWLR